MAEPSPLPTGTSLEPAPDLRRLAQGRVLIGGAPLTITRLSTAGASLVTGWFAGNSVSDNPRHQQLARRLVRAGMAYPRYGHRRPNEADQGQLTVVIPVKDDQSGLNATLEALRASEGPQPVGSIIVVDDGSRPPIQGSHRSLATDSPVADKPMSDPDLLFDELVRNETATGPGPARQAGIALVTTELIAFIDAGVIVTPADLARLAETFGDEAVVAVAPRVASSPAPHLVGKFDRTRSPLDLGPGQSLVGPGRQVPYVPSACLLVRADSLEQVGGFDPALRYGEDVDLVWRLGTIGEVRYQPSVVVRHPPRPNLASMARQRRSYGSAAAPLAVRHGDAVAPVKVSPWSAAVFSLAVAGRPLAALATATGTGLALRPKIEPLPDATVEAFLLTGRGHWYGGLSILTAAVRAWSPLLFVAWLLFPSQRRRLGSVAVAAFARRLLDGPKSPTDAARDVALGAVDDLSYCAGVWEGFLRQPSAGSVKALLPSMVSWPKPRSSRGYSAMNRSSS